MDLMEMGVDEISWIDEDGKALERQSQTRGRDGYIGTIQGRRNTNHASQATRKQAMILQ